MKIKGRGGEGRVVTKHNQNPHTLHTSVKSKL